VDIFRSNNFTALTGAMIMKGYNGLKGVIKGNEGERIYD